MRYTVCVFDFDYTLADATPGIVKSMNYSLDRLGLNPENRDDIKRTVGMTLKEAFHKLTGVTDTQSTDLFITHFKEMADKVMTDNTSLFDDTVHVLSELKYLNCNTAIVTSKAHYRIDEVLGHNGISELVDYIVGFEDVDAAKPSPEGLLRVIQHFSCDKGSVLYIGDSLIDANTAVNAGVDFAAVITGTTTEDEFAAHPFVHIANNLTGLLEYIKGR